MPTSQPLPQKALTAALLMTTAGLLAASQAQALTSLNEVTFFLTGSEFNPGGKAQTQVIFAAAPALELSGFTFELKWSSDLASPLLTGSRSIADLAATLDKRGVFETHSGGLRSIAGSWHANAPAPSSDIITVSNAQHLNFYFDFQTAPALTDDFAVGFGIDSLRDGAGEPIDTGSGLFNSVVLSAVAHPLPVPEPHAWALMLAGLVATAAFARKNSCLYARQ